MAGSFGSSSDDDVISGINITPLVDVVLVLLIIFMITAPVIYQKAISVQLPQAKSGEQADQSPINLSVSKDGALHWDSEAVSWETLSERLLALNAGMKDKNAELTAIINADEAASHGTVVKLMDTLRAAGLTRFALSVAEAAK